MLTNLWIKWISTQWGGITWNLFLAVVPVALAFWIRALSRKPGASPIRNIWIWLLGVLWLIFLPNTCYLLTEWRHFLETLDGANLYLASHTNTYLTIKLMYYTVFYFLYSGAGLITFALAIRPIAGILRRQGANLWIYGCALFILSSLGIYLGLIHRFNSWDFINRPEVIMDTVKSLAYRPLLSAFIIIFGGVLWLAYLAIDVWIDGFLLRWNAVSGKGAKTRD